MDVDAVVFDLYGTLLDVTSVEAACAELTEDPGALVALWRQKQLEYTWLRALMDRYQDFWAITAAALDHATERVGLELKGQEKARLLGAWLALRPYPELPEALDRLGPRTLAVLSNGTPRMLEEALRSAGLGDRIARVISAEEVRTYKPAPAVYALVERTLGMPRDRALFASANAWDAAGAKAFGLPVAWVNRAGVPTERLGVTPDLVVADIADLADRVAV